jgi:hypothetical protein
MDEKPFVNLSSLADRTGLPSRWLQGEADAGRIPFLIVGKRQMFNPETVERVLTARSQNSKPEATVG